MASFSCHAFGVTKRFRLERIVRPQPSVARLKAVEYNVTAQGHDCQERQNHQPEPYRLSLASGGLPVDEDVTAPEAVPEIADAKECPGRKAAPNQGVNDDVVLYLHGSTAPGSWNSPSEA